MRKTKQKKNTHKKHKHKHMCYINEKMKKELCDFYNKKYTLIKRWNRNVKLLEAHSYCAHNSVSFLFFDYHISVSLFLVFFLEL